MKRLALFVGAIALIAILGALPVQAQLGASVEEAFGPDVTYPFCIDFDFFADGFEVSAILADKMVVGTWQNWDGFGSNAPLLGGFTKGPPRRNYMMGNTGFIAPGEIWVLTLEVDLETFDLWYQDLAGNIVQQQNNQPWTFRPGPCPFRPDGGLPPSGATN